jgi:tRNA nucleotidyltransferase/poly(A) polymerase
MPAYPEDGPGSEHAYSGRWVARLQGKVIAQGGTPRQALQAAKAARAKENPSVEYMASPQVYSLPPIVDRVRAALPAGQEVYLVGGAVRDLLLNRPLRDLDFALPGPVIPIARKLAQALKADFYPLDTERDAGRVLLMENGERLTLDFVAIQGADIDTDLAGRDLTVNAMAIDLRQPHALLDPLGGAQDLIEKRLRACTPSSFSDDPVRVLRAVRFAAGLGIQLDPDSRERMRAAAPGLKQVSAERIRDEFFHLLETHRLVTALRVLDKLGALDVVFPELQPLKGLPQPTPHLFDVWEHSLRVVEGLQKTLTALDENYPEEGASDLQSGLIVLRLGRYRSQIAEHFKAEAVPERSRRSLLLLAALLHDSGKALTGSVGDDGRIHFYEHETRGAKLLATRFSAMQLSNTEKDLLDTIVRNHMRPMQLTRTGKPPSRRAIYRFFRDTGAAGVDVCLLSLGDLMGKYGVELPEDELKKHLDTLRIMFEAYYERNVEIVSPPILLDGDDLMRELKITPGPKVGKILEALREAQAGGDVTTREQALAFARGMR